MGLGFTGLGVATQDHLGIVSTKCHHHCHHPEPVSLFTVPLLISQTLWEVKVEVEVGAQPAATALAWVAPTIVPCLEGDMPWPMKQRMPIIIAIGRGNNPEKARLRGKGATT